MSSSVIVRLNVDSGPDLELTPAAARELWEQLNTLFGGQQRPCVWPVESAADGLPLGYCG